MRASVVQWRSCSLPSVRHEPQHRDARRRPSHGAIAWHPEFEACGAAAGYTARIHEQREAPSTRMARLQLLRKLHMQLSMSRWGVPCAATNPAFSDRWPWSCAGRVTVRCEALRECSPSRDADSREGGGATGKSHPGRRQAESAGLVHANRRSTRRQAEMAQATDRPCPEGMRLGCLAAWKRHADIRASGGKAEPEGFRCMCGTWKPR